MASLNFRFLLIATMLFVSIHSISVNAQEEGMCSGDLQEMEEVQQCMKASMKVKKHPGDVKAVSNFLSACVKFLKKLGFSQQQTTMLNHLMQNRIQQIKESKTDEELQAKDPDESQTDSKSDVPVQKTEENENLISETSDIKPELADEIKIDTFSDEISQSSKESLTQDDITKRPEHNPDSQWEQSTITDAETDTFDYKLAEETIPETSHLEPPENDFKNIELSEDFFETLESAKPSMPMHDNKQEPFDETGRNSFLNYDTALPDIAEQQELDSTKFPQQLRDMPQQDHSHDIPPHIPDVQHAIPQDVRHDTPQNVPPPRFQADIPQQKFQHGHQQPRFQQGIPQPPQNIPHDFHTQQNIVPPTQHFQPPTNFPPPPGSNLEADLQYRERFIANYKAEMARLGFPDAPPPDFDLMNGLQPALSPQDNTRQKIHKPAPVDFQQHDRGHAKPTGGKKNDFEIRENDDTYSSIKSGGQKAASQPTDKTNIDPRHHHSFGDL